MKEKICVYCGIETKNGNKFCSYKHQSEYNNLKRSVSNAEIHVIYFDQDNKKELKPNSWIGINRRSRK